MKLRILLISAAISILTLAALPAAAQSSATNTVAYNGFSFSYDATLAGHVDIDEMPSDANGLDVKRTQFTVSNADTTPSIFDAVLGIQVYNTADLASNANANGQLQKLQALLSAKTDPNSLMTTTNATAPENSLPFIPVAAAGQAIRARVQYVSTPTVSGISYITVYKQDVSPFLSNEFFYTFQGFSSDGTHYVAAVFKLNTAFFPAQTPSDFNMDTFRAGFDQYMQQSLTTLNSAQPTDFTPSLATFDAVIQSFIFVPNSASQPQVQPPVGSDATFGGLTAANWILASYGPAEAPIPVLPNAPINLIFTKDGISGSSGCNTYFGQFHFDVNALTFSGIGSTLMACTDPAVMQQETDYLNALRTATNYQIDNGVLKITYQKGALTFNGGTPPVVMTATPVVGGNASLGGLAGVNWVLSSFGPAAAPVAVIAGTALTATFTTEGVSGSAGCNSYSGNFTYDNSNLTFSPLITTKMACTDANIMTQETTYLTALQSATSYQINNGQLQITYPDGVLTFNASTAPTPTPSAPATPIVNTDPTLGGLAGVHWVLVSYGPTTAPVAALANAPINIDFTQQGVSGNSGCNQYSGTFVYNNGTLTFSPLISTQKACTDANVMTQETTYLTALQAATAYQIANSQLMINYPDGVLTFKGGA